MASDPEQHPRRTGRHAAPRLTVRGRMQLPVGRALALTAVPTALLMGSLAPKLALAADAKAVPVSSTTHEAQAAKGADCGTPTAAPSTAATAAGKAAKASPKTAAKSAAPKASASAATPQHATGGKKAAAPSAAPTPSATSTPSAAPSPSPSHASHPDPITGLLGALGGILNPHAQQAAPTTAAAAPKADTASVPGPAATPTAAPTQAAPTQAPTGAPTATATPTAADPSKPAVPPAPSAAPTTDPALSAKAQANRMCDVSSMAAPLDATVTPGEMPADPWTLKTTKLALGNTQFWGVKTVKTAAGDVRVLKFTAQTVGIGDLDMSVKQQTGELLHVKGGPGTTSTMTGGTVTMYVTSLSGTLAKAEGIPLAALGIKLTLTPDTLPEWLYDLVGSVPIPLNLELDDATAIQTGQFGGNLTIPGMRLFYTPLS
ncbi:hypothetical protein [Streptacidiphilus cavernicola]|uniref:DUF2993 domain-containing protein n=1 Tax=Streptacidiphilus cavernicola TaxID=3342716 RepID=A0ABV6W2H7_9ACTN